VPAHPGRIYAKRGNGYQRVRFPSGRAYPYQGLRGPLSECVSVVLLVHDVRILRVGLHVPCVRI